MAISWQPTLPHADHSGTMVPGCWRMPMNDPWLRLQHAADRDISLLSAALLIAKDEYPDLRAAEYERRVEEYAATLATDLSEICSETTRLFRLNNFLFGELGFAGDEHN